MAWDLSHITKQVEEQAVEHAQDISLEMYREINALMPVDTSRLVSNVYISAIEPENYDDENRMLGRGGAYLAGGRDEILAMKTLQPIFIDTIVPYAQKIENGGSRQAPNGVFRLVFSAVARKYGY